MLTEMLRNSRHFQELPEEQRMIFARLASTFEESTDNLFKSPEELQSETLLGNRFQWASLLSMETTQQYIKGQIAQVLQTMQRKTLLSLKTEAAAGNVQAIKEIKELSGIMDRADTNKTIVLHQISRPKPVKEVQQ